MHPCPHAITVQSLPGRLMSALPNGIKKSPSGTSPLLPYIDSFSKKITGSSSRIAVFNNPFASAGDVGTTTFSPGTCVYNASTDHECVAASCCPGPEMPRKTTGTLNCPPDIYAIFGALLTTWSNATSENENVINSTIGRIPAIAEPTPSPAKPHSEIGASTTRIGPYLASIPFETLYAPSYSATSSPIKN